MGCNLPAAHTTLNIACFHYVPPPSSVGLPPVPPSPSGREELKDLGKIVANCHNLVFILTDNIFDSHWCMEELQVGKRSAYNQHSHL